ncbi:hypothetical protein [uncultured Nocardioides sp.]|uniref:hypothetical protein n=1 Tax=uncultured Nocardioides sp. TaxID=198441 RepID=UPI0026333DB9|nr:hypothetical protein [uncultured Nocardioides sp.]
MTQPALWWQHHRMRPPVMGREMRWAVARYPWGVAVWEKPLHWVAPAGMRVVDVVVTDPTAPIDLAQAHAVERLPRPPRAQRVASALPFPASARSVTAATVVALLVLLVVTFQTAASPALGRSDGLVLLLLAGLPAVVAALALADRVPPHHHPAAWRRRGHDAASVPFTGRIQLADALCQRSAHQPYAAELRHAVRAALWECRADRAAHHEGRPRLDAWLDDLDEGDRLAAEVLEHVPTATDPGPGTVVGRAAEVVPELVASLATPSPGQRAGALRQLAELRDACEEAVAARESLARTVDAVAHEPEPTSLLGRSERAEWVATRVEDLLGDLRAEATILREVDSELRTRDGGDVHGR